MDTDVGYSLMLFYLVLLHFTASVEPYRGFGLQSAPLYGETTGKPYGETVRPPHGHPTATCVLKRQTSQRPELL